MKVLIVTSHAAGVEGGSSYLAQRLEQGLRRGGVDVDLVSLPFVDTADNPLRQMLAFRSFSAGLQYDRVIALRWPSHLVRHPHKVTWFHHHKRDLFDLYGTQFSARRDGPESRRLRRLVANADTVALAESARVFALSSQVADRLKEINGIDSTVLHAAPSVTELKGLQSRDARKPHSVLYLNRVTSIKRQRLMVEAMPFLPTDFTLTIAGYPESLTYLEELRRLSRDLGVDDRVAIDGKPMDPRARRRLLSTADCVANFPFMEDSHGFPTLEGAAVQAALVTTSDSGGIGEFVRQDQTGWVCAPKPREIARAIRSACELSETNFAIRAAARDLAFDFANSFDSRLMELIDEA